MSSILFTFFLPLILFGLNLAGAAPALAEFQPLADLVSFHDGQFQVRQLPQAQVDGRYPTGPNGLAFDTPASLKTYLAVHKRLRPVISSDEAMALFTWISHQPQIPFRYLKEGCEARAFEMSALLELRGVYSRKISIVRDYGNRFDVRNPVTGEKYSWLFHIAPVVAIRGADGRAFKAVLDPSLFPHPVSPEEWKARIYSDYEKNGCPDVAPLFYSEKASGQNLGRCYAFETERYFYSPFVADYDIPGQVRLTDWDADLSGRAQWDLLNYASDEPETGVQRSARGMARTMRRNRDLLLRRR